MPSQAGGVQAVMRLFQEVYRYGRGYGNKTEHPGMSPRRREHGYDEFSTVTLHLLYPSRLVVRVNSWECSMHLNRRRPNAFTPASIVSASLRILYPVLGLSHADN